MKKALTILLAVAALFATTQVAARPIKPSGKIVTEVRSVGEFSGIAVSAGIEVFLTQGLVQEVKIKTDRNAIDYVETKIRNGVLHIGYSNNTSTNGRIATAVYVSVPEINSLSASSGADITARGVLRGDDLKVSASSAANVKAIVQYESVSISCSSGADVELKGNAEYCSASCSSGADIEIDELKCREVRASASSGADISLYATHKLTASASSGADIKYYGAPPTVNQSASSGGSVRAAK